MVRNLKVLGFALVVVFAMSAMAAAAASAQQGVLTSDGLVKLSGTDEEGEGLNYFEYSNLLPRVECPDSSYVGEKVGTGFLQSGETTATIIPSYNNATCHAGAVKDTVITNGCDFVFHIGKTTGSEDEYGVTADVVCPTGQSIEVHVYASPTSEAVQTCLVKVGPQTGITGLDIKNEVVEGHTNDTLTITGESANVKASKSGACGAGSTETAHYKATVTIKGKNEEGSETGVTITD